MTRRRRKGGTRFAFRASALVAFIDAHSDYVTDGSPRRTRRTLNGKAIEPSTDARTIRRWRSGRFEGVTRPTAKRLLRTYGLTLDQLVQEHTDAVLRGTYR